MIMKNIPLIITGIDDGISLVCATPTSKPKDSSLVGPEKGTLRHHRHKLILGCREEQRTQEVE